MFRVCVFRSTYDGKPWAAVNEVEPVEWQGQTMYRDIETGRVDPMYEFAGEQVFDTREEAVSAAVSGLHRLTEEFTALCLQEIAKLHGKEVPSVVA